MIIWLLIALITTWGRFTRAGEEKGRKNNLLDLLLTCAEFH